MDGAKKSELIKRCLKREIGTEEFDYEMGYDLFNLSSDSIELAMRKDISDAEDAARLKTEILYFDKEQEKEQELYGSTYIENKKRVLALDVNRYPSLLVDSEIRTIMEKWGTPLEQPAEEYKNTSFTNLWNAVKNNPEYRSEIQQYLLEIDGEDGGLSEELKELSDTITNREEEIKVQNAKREELESFMDETLHAFESLSQIENMDVETAKNVKTALIESYKIYIEKYSQLAAELENNPEVFVTNLDLSNFEPKKELAPVFQEKKGAIEKLIEQLEGKYGQFKQDIQAKEKTKQESDFVSSLQGKVADDREYAEKIDEIDSKTDIESLEKTAEIE